MADVSVEFNGLDVVDDLLKRAEGGGNVIQQYFNEEGATLVKQNIISLLPRSNRNHRHAADSQPFTQSVSDLTLTVKTKPSFGYLYFPDDGTNTEHHAGEQHFMDRGLEAVKSEMTDNMVTKLTDYINGE